MKLKTVGTQATLDGGIKEVKRNDFPIPFSELRKLAESEEREECRNCGTEKPKRKMLIGMQTYSTPWRDEPDQPRYFCSERCEEVYLFEPDFAFFACEVCYRLVCEQNPSNGWMVQYRIVNECEQICLRCYEEDMLQNGQPDSDFDGGSIHGGMFFNYGNHELDDAGYECLLDHKFIGGGLDAGRFNQQARDYIEQGYQLVTAFERMAIGGLEGTVSLYGKRRES